RSSAEGLGKAAEILDFCRLTAHAAHGAKLAEQVIQVDPFGAEVDVRSARPGASAAEPTEAAGRLEAEAIVLLAFFLVAEQVIGVLNFLELGFGLFVTGIAVRMMLSRQFAVGALDLVGAGVARHSEHFVWIARHGLAR